MDIIEDRHERKSTLIASQIPAKELYDAIVDKTMADAVMDRIVYQVVRIELYGSLSGKCKLKRIKKLARRKIMFIFAKKTITNTGVGKQNSRKNDGHVNISKTQ